MKIFTQIVVLQATYYLCATVLILFTALVAGQHFNLDLIFDWRSLRGDTTVGWMLGLVWMLNSLVRSVPSFLFSLDEQEDEADVFFGAPPASFFSCSSWRDPSWFRTLP